MEWARRDAGNAAVDAVTALGLRSPVITPRVQHMITVTNGTTRTDL
jgi:hypothetical protein